MKRKPTKIERMIAAVGGDEWCESGIARAARKYRGLTLHQAWRKADAQDIRELCSRLNVSAPISCGVCPNRKCWAGDVRSLTANEIRQKLKKIPSAIQRAYTKA